MDYCYGPIDDTAGRSAKQAVPIVRRTMPRATASKSANAARSSVERLADLKAHYAHRLEREHLARSDLLEWTCAPPIVAAEVKRKRAGA